jgi:UDP-N-acetylmuramate--alanine ligase
MNMQKYRTVYFLGIGGIGMSALARYFRMLGASVSGYDKTPTPLTNSLIKEGIPVHFEENPLLIPETPDLIVYTPAIPKDNVELRFVIENNFPLKKRSEILGLISDGTKTIAVAGTHGKTTITTLIAHIFRNSEKESIAFLGGISKNYHSNLIISGKQETGQAGSPEYFIAEADEFDRSFLRLFPDIAVITSADADHLDIYGSVDEVRNSFGEFTSQVQPDGTLIMKKGTEVIPENTGSYSLLTYDLDGNGDFHPANIRITNSRYLFDLITPTRTIPDILLRLPGKFNLENAIAASAVAVTAGIPDEAIVNALKDFEGVERRFDVQVLTENFAYIDDYAHHPEELKACIRAVREIFPGKKITGIFQPHLFTRTRDFADEFARSLELLDSLILLEIYPAREKPVENVDSAMLLKKVNMTNKKLCSKESLLNELKTMKPEVLLTLGAGDIDQMVKPIKEMFTINS